MEHPPSTVAPPQVKGGAGDGGTAEALGWERMSALPLLFPVHSCVHSAVGSQGAGVGWPAPPPRAVSRPSRTVRRRLHCKEEAALQPDQGNSWLVFRITPGQLV